MRIWQETLGLMFHVEIHLKSKNPKKVWSAHRLGPQQILALLYGSNWSSWTLQPTRQPCWKVLLSIEDCKTWSPNLSNASIPRLITQSTYWYHIDNIMSMSMSTFEMHKFPPSIHILCRYAWSSPSGLLHLETFWWIPEGRLSACRKIGDYPVCVCVCHSNETPIAQRASEASVHLPPGYATILGMFDAYIVVK